MKIRNPIIFLFTLFFLFALNCGTKSGKKKMVWEDVKRINQYRIYNQFLQENPETVHRKEIELSIDSLKQKWLTEMRDVKTLSITFEEEFPEGYNFSKGRNYIIQQIKKILKDTDIKYVKNNKIKTDVDLKVKITGDPLGRRYKTMNRSSTTSIHYPGAKINGQISLVKNDKEIPCALFNGIKPVQNDYIWTSEYDKKSKAPFMKAFLQSSFQASSYVLFNSMLNLPPFTAPILDIPPFMYGNLGEWTRPYLSYDENSLYVASGRKINGYELKKGIKWRFETDLDIQSAPILVNNYLLLQTPKQILVLNKENGRHQSHNFKLLQALKLKKEKEIPIEANSVILAFISYDGDLYVFNSQTGIFNGKYNIKPDVSQSIPLNFQQSCRPFLVDESTVYVGTLYKSSKSYLFAFDGKTSSLKWKFETNDYILTRPLVKDNTIYFGSDDDYFYALDKDNGTLKWKYKTRGNITSNPSSCNNHVYIASSDNYLYAFDRSTGSLKWKFKTKEPVQLNPVVFKDKVYICSSTHLYAINSVDATLNWEFNIPDNQKFSLGPIVLKNTLYAGNRYVYALDAKSGILKWSYKPNIESAELNLSVLFKQKSPTICVTSEFGNAYFIFDEIKNL